MNDSVQLPLHMRAQPDDRSCGPTCLQAVYRFFEREESLSRMIDEIPQLESGGTLAVQLACHALQRGFRATIYTYNLQLFDPTWLATADIDIADRLRQQVMHKADDGRLGHATEQYLHFLELGGRIKHELLGADLLLRFLRAGLPILTGLSATYLYDAPRELPEIDRPDDIRGEPVGHFVVLSGYDPATREVTVADPWPDRDNPGQSRSVSLKRVTAAILLGVLTYDANLLVLEPT